MKVVVNRCFGGFGLSLRAYERLIELGIRRVPHVAQKRNPVTALYEPGPDYNGSIVDYEHPESTFEDERIRESMKRLGIRYTADWLNGQRNNPLLVQVVEELGPGIASSNLSQLAIVEIPDDVDWEISEYDGRENVVEKHRSW